VDHYFEGKAKICGSLNNTERMISLLSSVILGSYKGTNIQNLSNSERRLGTSTKTRRICCQASNTLLPSEKLGSQLEDPSISGQANLEIDEHDLQKRKEEAIEVSYSVIITDQLAKQTSDDLLQKIATMVNVQLAEEGSEKVTVYPIFRL
jgi:hypothetical protein